MSALVLHEGAAWCSSWPCHVEPPSVITDLAANVLVDDGVCCCSWQCGMKCQPQGR
jgi:hypothetical protein